MKPGRASPSSSRWAATASMCGARSACRGVVIAGRDCVSLRARRRALRDDAPPDGAGAPTTARGCAHEGRAAAAAWRSSAAWRRSASPRALVLNAFQQQPGVLLQPVADRRQRSAARPQLPPRRAGRRPAACGARRTRPARCTSSSPTWRRRSRSSTPACCPTCSREGKGVVAQGRLGADGVFHADQVLAKHDENYMPPEAAEALAKARHATAMHEQRHAGRSRQP